MPQPLPETRRDFLTAKELRGGEDPVRRKGALSSRAPFPRKGSFSREQRLREQKRPCRTFYPTRRPSLPSVLEKTDSLPRGGPSSLSLHEGFALEDRFLSSERQIVFLSVLFTLRNSLERHPFPQRSSFSSFQGAIRRWAYFDPRR